MTELTSDEIQNKLKTSLPRDKRELEELQEQIVRYMGRMYGGEDPLYQKLRGFLKNIEFKLQWKEMQSSNKRLFWVAIIVPIISKSTSLFIPKRFRKNDRNSFQ